MRARIMHRTSPRICMHECSIPKPRLRAISTHPSYACGMAMTNLEESPDTFHLILILHIYYDSILVPQILEPPTSIEVFVHLVDLRRVKVPRNLRDSKVVECILQTKVNHQLWIT